MLGGIADPEGKRGTVERDTVRRQHLGLTIERQMPLILSIDHVRDEPLGRQSAPDQSFRRGVLENDAITSAAGQFGPTGHDHTILRRYDVQPLALIAANLKKDAFAGRAASFSRHQSFDDTRQTLRQLATALSREL